MPSGTGRANGPRLNGSVVPAEKKVRKNKIVPHFCIFQGDDFGLSGWSKKDGCRQNRWDTLLDAVLKCVMMDGEWPREVKASVFAGADAFHVTGAIQTLIMPVVGTRADGRLMYAPATTHSWEDALWSNYGSDHLPGLRWELDLPGSEKGKLHHRSPGAAQEILLRRLDTFLEEVECESALVIALDYRDVDATYERLKARGLRREPTASHVFFLLGGAHGFDGKNDHDNHLFEEILKRFKQRFGSKRVARVNLCEEDSDNAKFTAAKVAAFLSVEHARGSLCHVMAGIEDMWQNHNRPATIAPWAPERRQNPLPTGFSIPGPDRRIDQAVQTDLRLDCSGDVNEEMWAPCLCRANLVEADSKPSTSPAVVPKDSPHTIVESKTIACVTTPYGTACVAERKLSEPKEAPSATEDLPPIEEPPDDVGDRHLSVSVAAVPKDNNGNALTTKADLTDLKQQPLTGRERHNGVLPHAEADSTTLKHVRAQDIAALVAETTSAMLPMTAASSDAGNADHALAEIAEEAEQQSEDRFPPSPKRPANAWTGSKAHASHTAWKVDRTSDVASADSAAEPLKELGSSVSPQPGVIAAADPAFPELKTSRTLQIRGNSRPVWGPASVHSGSQPRSSSRPPQVCVEKSSWAAAKASTPATAVLPSLHRGTAAPQAEKSQVHEVSSPLAQAATSQAAEVHAAVASQEGIARETTPEAGAEPVAAATAAAQPLADIPKAAEEGTEKRAARPRAANSQAAEPQTTPPEASGVAAQDRRSSSEERPKSRLIPGIRLSNSSGSDAASLCANLSSESGRPSVQSPAVSGQAAPAEALGSSSGASGADASKRALVSGLGNDGSATPRSSPSPSGSAWNGSRARPAAGDQLPLYNSTPASSSSRAPVRKAPPVLSEAEKERLENLLLEWNEAKRTGGGSAAKKLEVDRLEKQLQTSGVNPRDVRPDQVPEVDIEVLFKDWVAAKRTKEFRDADKIRRRLRVRHIEPDYVGNDAQLQSLIRMFQLKIDQASVSHETAGNSVQATDTLDEVPMASENGGRTPVTSVNRTSKPSTSKAWGKPKADEESKTVKEASEADTKNHEVTREMLELDGKKIPVHTLEAPGGPATTGISSEVANSLCFQPSRSLLLYLEGELRRLLEEPVGSTLHLPWCLSNQSSPLKWLCRHLGLQYEIKEEVQELTVISTEARALNPIPLQAFMPRSWGKGSSPFEVRIAQVAQSAEASVSQLRASESDAPELTIAEGDALFKNVNLKSSAWSLDGHWELTGAGSAGNTSAAVTTLVVDTSEESGLSPSLGIVLYSSSQEIRPGLDLLLSRYGLPQDPGVESDRSHTVSSDADSTYVMFLEAEPQKSAWSCRGAFLSKHLEQRTVNHDGPCTIPWHSPLKATNWSCDRFCESSTTIWVASSEDTKGHRLLEVGSGLFPENLVFKVSLKSGPAFQNIGFVALPSSREEGKKPLERCVLLRSLHFARGLCSERASAEHILHLRWCRDYPPPSKVEQKLRKLRQVAAWLPIESNHSNTGSNGTALSDHIAVCLSPEAGKVVRAEALISGYAVAHIGDKCLRLKAD